MHNFNKKRIFAFGECMAELTLEADLNTRIRFSGDVYNTLIYAKRWRDDFSTSLVSAVGTDALSLLMRKDAQKNNIDLQHVITTKHNNLGIYTINNDGNGECWFDYWRNTSAASQYFNLLSQDHIKSITEEFEPGALVYFTGVSIGILNASDKDKLLYVLSKLKNAGFTLVFDPNYRAKLWKNASEAACYIKKCYALSDIIFPGIEDHHQLFGHENLAQVYQYCEQFTDTEIIIKAAHEGVLGIDKDGVECHIPFIAADSQVDATAAGDSFAGIYLAERAHKQTMASAIKIACDVARVVVSHKGAVLPADVFNQFKNSYPMTN